MLKFVIKFTEYVKLLQCIVRLCRTVS